MLHRFADPERNVAGFDPARLRLLLSYLRRHRYQLVDLRTILGQVRGDGPPIRRAVAFTIDDGYREQATVAAPIFAEFDCPVTTFVVTGFLDGALWLWWDRIAFIFRHTTRPALDVAVNGARRHYVLGSRGEKERGQDDFTSYCKRVPDAVRDAALHALATAADVEVPHSPPATYGPMTWDELRSAERRGMTFGPHTVTHPILSHTDDQRSRAEIRDSWQRLQAEARSPVPVFAYPNGTTADYGAREIQTARHIGLEGACSCILAYTTLRRLRAPDGAFHIPRFAMPDDLAHFIQLVSGLERLKQLLRRED
jgi:peptidoglycan/xylan/chitin deacetylase (PgdA/CDA1 family)